MRSRLERALFTRGEVMSDPQVADDRAEDRAGDRADDRAEVVTPGVVAFLIVRDARRAVIWYAEVFGARPRGEAMVMEDGRIGHSELEVAGSVIYLADDPATLATVAAPEPRRGVSVTLVVAVDDVDAAVNRAVAAGAELERPAADHPYGRNAVIQDPFGHRWMLSGPAVGTGPPDAQVARQGDVGYVSLWVPDDVASAEFFASVLGWRYTPATDQSRLRDGAVPAQGLVGATGLAASGRPLDHPTASLSFVVDDVDAAVERVRAAGGTAAEPRETPYGRSAECVDDQGMEFAVHHGGPAEPRPTVNGSEHGDVSYLSIEVVDGARARTFYATVLGWTYAPGHAADGVAVLDNAPMMGMVGGRPRATIVPSYRVTDIGQAADRIREGGGTATEPEERPYGLEVSGSDPSGLRFYLHQL
jgi:predicted enzyme related to lactoylglutathione lyase